MSIEKLMKCLEMMSSEHDGEVLNAAKMANKIMKQMKLSWNEIIVVRTAPAPTPPARPAPSAAVHAMHPQQQYPFGQQGFYGNPFANMGFNDINQAMHFAQQQAYAQSKVYNQRQQQHYYPPRPDS